jgi:plasmid stability protein
MLSRKEDSMAQFVVRNLEDSVTRRLKRRAEKNGRSMEEEVRHILRNAVKDEGSEPVRLGTRIASRFASIGLKEDIREFRGESLRPANFRR